MPIQEVRLLKNRNVFLFTFSQAISQLGDRINNMAILSLLGTHAMGSSEYSFLAFWTVIPVVFFGPIAGAITDRFNRKLVMIVSDLARALLVTLLIFLFKSFKDFRMAYLIVFCVFTFTVLFNSAKNGIVVHIAGNKSNLAILNSMLNFWGRIATGLGILFGGIISDRFLWKSYDFEGWEVGLFVDGLTFLLSAILLVFIYGDGEYIKPQSETKAKISYIHSISEGIRFVKKRKILFYSLMATALISFVGAITYILGIVKLQKVGHTGTAQLGLVGGIYGLGLFAGSYLAGRVLKGREYKLLWDSVLILGLTLLGIALTSNLLVLSPLFAIGGIFTSLGFIGTETIFQKYSTADYIGRVVVLKDIVNALTFTFVVILMGLWNDILTGFIGFENALNINLVASSLFVVMSWVLRRFFARGNE